MENQSELKKTFIFNVVDFLIQDLGRTDFSGEARASIDVAMQCLRTAYKIRTEDPIIPPKINLMHQVRILDQGLTLEQLAVAEHHKNLGIEAGSNGDFASALAFFTKCIEVHPKNGVYFSHRAEAYSGLNNNEEAIKDCKQSLILDPFDGTTYGRLGIAYSNLNDWPEAVKAFQQCFRYDPQNMVYRNALRVATEKLIDSMESAAPPQHRPIDITQFVNNEPFLNMAREMMAVPDYAMPPNDVPQPQNQEPRFPDNGRRPLEPPNPNVAGPNRHEHGDDGSSRDA